MYPFYEWEKYEESQLLKYTQRMASVQSFMNEVLDQDVNSKATNDIEFDQYIFDDVMLNLLNLNGEVGIGNEIYHYLPYGLFITSTDKGLAALTEISNSPEVVRNLLVKSLNHLGEEIIISEGLRMLVPQKGKQAIESWFFQGGELVNDNSKPEDDFTKDLDQTSLTLCSIRSRSVFNSIFGPSTYCIDNFDRRRRVKTRVFDQDYLVAQTLGMSAKAQVRTFGAWWALNVDELELGCEFLDYQFPPGFNPPPNNFFNNTLIMGARLSDGTFIGFNGQVLNSGPVFESMKSLSDNLPFIPQIDSDVLQVRIFVNYLGINQTFSASDFLNFRELVDDLIEEQVPSFLVGIDACFDGAQDCLFDPPTFDNRRLEFINMGNQRVQITISPIERNRRNIANMAHYFDFNTGQIGISGNSGSLSPDFSNILNTFDYDVLRGLVWGAGRRGNTVRGNYVATALNN